MNFHQFPWQDFARGLRERYQRQIASEQTQPAVPEPPAGAPIVFLCHENRDKPRAESLAEQLQTSGIKIWLDKQSLRGGDNWARAIPHVIEKQTDYVIVLQSPRMLDKTESYFRKEIKFALERQDGFFGSEMRFVIPVLLESHPKLPLRDLSDLHVIDLTEPHGVDALAQTILEDWQKRQTIQGTY